MENYKKRIMEIIPTEYIDKVLATKRNRLELTTEKGNKLPITTSKLGGYGFIPKNIEYPLSQYDMPLSLLAQINFAEMPELKGLPTSGILAFYIDNYDGLGLYGLDFEDPTKQLSFKIFYFDDLTQEHYTEEEIEDIFADIVEYDTPISVVPIEEEFKITGEVTQQFLLTDSVEFEENYGLTYHEFLADICQSEDEDVLEEFSDKLKELDPLCHQIGGYPRFYQEDPRERYPGYDFLLFQLYSQEGVSQWQDGGIGNFFIKSENLAKLDFSDTLYNFDIIEEFLFCQL